MPKGLKRYYGQGDLHFLTFSCYQRQPLLGTAYTRDFFVDALSVIRTRYAFFLVGYVVMPEHVHLLLSEPPASTVSTVLQALKQRVSRDLRRDGHGSLLAVGKPSGDLPRFWQQRFYDFNVHSAAKRKEKLDYMHANPVSRGLVDEPGEWPWSSWKFYNSGETGPVQIDPVT